MGHVHVSHPSGRLEVVPICSRQIGRRASRYDPFGTLSLITGFVSSLTGGLAPGRDAYFSDCGNVKTQSSLSDSGFSSGCNSIRVETVLPSRLSLPC